MKFYLLVCAGFHLLVVRISKAPQFKCPFIVPTHLQASFVCSINLQLIKRKKKGGVGFFFLKWNMEHQDFLPLSQPSKGARSSRFNTCTQAQATVHSSLLKSGCHDTPFIFSRCWLVDLEYTHHSHIGFCSRDHQNKKKMRLRRGETTKALIPRLDDVQQGKQKIVTFFTAWEGKEKKKEQ